MSYEWLNKKSNPKISKNKLVHVFYIIPKKRSLKTEFCVFYIIPKKGITTFTNQIDLSAFPSKVLSWGKNKKILGNGKQRLKLRWTKSNYILRH